ncbi:hypothetical protein [Parasediminibacterium sp. JCM 36343]|uniref:hypothetical protein n=1 Tax=Parasediminibacterium sp. JCM 36343 TaxID=3374279 RepID=UPI00397BD64B
MYKYPILFIFTLIIASFSLNAQQPLKVAVFAPIYTDSAFDGIDYKLGINNLPSNMMAGLDFYNGVMMAIDSLDDEGKNMEVLFYDSRGKESISSIIRKPEFNDVNLIIAAFNNRQDIKPLADFAFSKKVPLVSSTYPNDGGVTENPYFVLINTSLKTHLTNIYSYLQRNRPTSNIIYIKKKGQLEDLIQSYFIEAAKTTAAVPLTYRTLEISDTSTAKSLLPYLDSTAQNTIVCGSINEMFGLKLVKMVACAKSYDCTVMGMPTWDGVKELDGYDCRGVNIVFSTPYNFPRTQTLVASLTKKYRANLMAKPSEMYFKGYESMLHFGSLLLENPTTVVNHIADKSFKVFTDFDIQPVRGKYGQPVEYLENKKLYFIKKLDGHYQ